MYSTKAMHSKQNHIMLAIKSNGLRRRSDAITKTILTEKD